MSSNLESLWEWAVSSFVWLGGLIFSNLLTLLGFILALSILLRVLREQRQPSSIIAWGGLIVLIPFVGVPLYLLFGGRKLKRRIRQKGKLTLDGVTAPEVREFFSVSKGEVSFIADGQKAFYQLMEALDKAQDRIHIMTYILTMDDVGKPVLEKLIQRASEGVHVRLLVDALGSFWVSRRPLRRLIAAGGEVHRFMPAVPLQTHGWANLRNHRKLVIIDDKMAIVGGRNLDLRFMGPKPREGEFRDMSVCYGGTAVEYLNRIFLSDWAFAAKKPLDEFSDEFKKLEEGSCGTPDLTGIASGPDVKGDILYDRIVNLVQECMEGLTIVTPYFVPDEVLHRSLCIKARSGKRIRLILPAKSNWKIVDVARRFYLRELYAAGVEIYLFKPGMLHAKIMCVDGRWLLHGSANFDIRSLFVNFEIGMLHDSSEDAACMGDWFENLLGQSRHYGDRRDLNPNWGMRLLEDATRLLAPLL